MKKSGIIPSRFLSAMKSSGISFVTGVPDSLLKEINACFLDSLSETEHIIAANEGSAIGLGLGHYLSSGTPALVYMQNSGVGNCVNPLVSLADPLVMGCPMLLLIGWRGEIKDDGDQLKDEPQHKQQGRTTLGILDVLEIPYQVIDYETDPEVCLEAMVNKAIERQGPVAMVVRKGSFSAWDRNNLEEKDEALMSRESAIRTVLDILPNSIPIVATTGMPSRELFELREIDQIGHHRDLLCVGGMGHAVSISAGIAFSRINKRVVCLDGDGAMLMHLGALTNASMCKNLIHIVINNGAHDSVGGQPTRAAELDLSEIAKACGYGKVARASSPEAAKKHLQKMLKSDQSCYLEILCRKGNRSDLGRPSQTPVQNKTDFMKFLSE